VETEDRKANQGGEERKDGASTPKKKVFPRRQAPNNFTRVESQSVSKPSRVRTDLPTSGQQNTTYGGGVLALVQAVSGEQPNEPYQGLSIPMNVSSLFDYLSTSVYRYVEQRSMRPIPLISENDVKLVFRYILAARIGQVANYHLPARPAEVRYPSLLGPLLASVGRYIHPTAGYELIPSLDPESEVWDGIIERRWSKRPNDVTPEDFVPTLEHWEIRVPADYDRVISVLMNMGMPENLGLPKDKVVANDDLYRLDDSFEQLSGSGDFAPSPGLLMNRALLEMAYLTEIYGHHRVVYVHLASLRAAVDKLARDSFSMEVGFN